MANPEWTDPLDWEDSTGLEFTADWLNAETCIENARMAYADSLCSEDGPVDTVISSGDLGVLIGLAEYALKSRAEQVAS